MDILIFEPLYQTRVWGGRSLQEKYDRKLPLDTPYGECWEVVDRKEEQSIVSHGKHAGCSLNELWTGEDKARIFGESLPDSARFPILIKILDCRADLSVQVHPPAPIAKKFGAEPKSEMWYIADADPGAKLYVGVKEGVTKDSFLQAIEEEKVSELIHAIEPRVGESIYLESGRLHAIGAGFLIFEIQQNSDTTYRVYDWGRVGLDGKPRDLHIAESMECIDFTDVNPTMDRADGNCLLNCEHFNIERHTIEKGTSLQQKNRDYFAIITVVSGTLQTFSGTRLRSGQTFIMPKEGNPLIAQEDACYLEITLPL